MVVAVGDAKERLRILMGSTIMHDGIGKSNPIFLCAPADHHIHHLAIKSDRYSLILVKSPRSFPDLTCRS